MPRSRAGAADHGPLGRSKHFQPGLPAQPNGPDPREAEAAASLSGSRVRRGTGRRCHARQNSCGSSVHGTPSHGGLDRTRDRSASERSEALEPTSFVSARRGAIRDGQRPCIDGLVLPCVSRALDRWVTAPREHTGIAMQPARTNEILVSAWPATSLQAAPNGTVSADRGRIAWTRGSGCGLGADTEPEAADAGPSPFWSCPS